MSNPPPFPNWIAAEATAQSITVWIMQSSQTVSTHEITLTATPQLTDLEALLREHAAPCVPVFASGFAGRSVKLPANVMQLPCETVQIDAWSVSLLPALVQDSPAAMLQSDVARVIGFLSMNPKWDGVLCLPGSTHSHWVLVSADEVISLQSCMTPAIASGLGAPVPLAALSADAVQDSLSKPELMAARFGEAAALQQRGQVSWPETTARLWGHLLGSELAATRPYWLGQNLALITSADLEQAYVTAFEAQYLPVTIASPTRVLQAGLHKVKTAS